jgi:glycosyltransferase involved in cell wall biosynthesis
MQYDRSHSLLRDGRMKSALTPEHIIFVPEIEAFGGAERGVLALCRWLDDNSMQHRVLLYRDRIGLGKYAGYPLPTVELGPPPKPLKKVASLRRYFAGVRPDGAKPLMAGSQAALHATLAGLKGFHTLMFDTPTLASDEGRIDTPTKWLRRKVTDRILRWGLRSGGKTIVNCDYLREECRQRYGGDIVISRMGGMQANEHFRPRIVDDRLRMLTVSRVEKNKRIDWIIRSLAALEHRPEPLSRRIGWHLDVVGKGALIEPLRAEAQDIGVGHRVTFHGFVDDQKLAALYDAAHLFLMPARQGYGLPALEALYRGIPVLVHRESGVSDILLDTRWCVVMQGGETHMPAAIEKSIGSLLNREHACAALPPIPTETEWAESVARLCGWC